MRALHPDQSGYVDRDGVPIYFEVFGAGGLTLLLVPPSPITHSRIWKALIPYLARHYRVVTLDGRGNGRSGRPTETAAHARAQNERDIVAVLDATGTAAAVVIAHCHANWWAVDIAAEHPDRVLALVAIEPGVPYLGLPQPHWVEAARRWDEVIEDATDWELCTRYGIVNEHRKWVEFFFGAQLVEPHSTKQHEDAVSWALESTGEILAAGEEAADLDPPAREDFERRCRELGVPVLVVHGDRDVCQHIERGRAFAELTGGDLVVIEGAGHLTIAREPVRVNRAIRAFVDRLKGPDVKTQHWTRGLSRPKRVLYVSSPIGLGHARRDVAIVKELRNLEPDLQVDWLAQDPVTRVLNAEGETIHPASRWLASESAHIASEAAGHDLHCFQALRNMDEILVANFMIFQEVVEEGLYDLVISDEAWDIDHFWHENPELKRGSHVWMTDFVGYLPMPDGGEREAFLTSDYNAEMIEHVARFPRIRDRAVFVGNPDDVIPESFGPGLPKIREWTEDHFGFSGYITGFTPPDPRDIEGMREELGFAPGEKVVVVTVGGSGVGRALLEKVIAAYPLAKAKLPELRMLVVAGPRIVPESLPSHDGLEVHGYIDRLYRHLSVCDLAVVQGGLTTTMELTAARRPFLYFPLRNHFEQNFHVRYRLDRYGAGRCLDFAGTGPDEIADAIVAGAGREVSYLPVETDGALRAAELVAELL
jgi:pimeloyl-ACP methyl ester carboxylesterase/predicted glycosyltransferase